MSRTFLSSQIFVPLTPRLSLPNGKGDPPHIQSDKLWQCLLLDAKQAKAFFSRTSNFVTGLFEARTDHSSSFVKFPNFVEKLWVFKTPPKTITWKHFGGFRTFPHKPCTFKSAQNLETSFWRILNVSGLCSLQVHWFILKNDWKRPGIRSRPEFELQHNQTSTWECFRCRLLAMELEPWIYILIDCHSAYWATEASLNYFRKVQGHPKNVFQRTIPNIFKTDR